MEKELFGILQALKGKTDIDIAVVSENGVIEANTYGRYVEFPSLDFSKIVLEPYCDANLNKTFFAFTFNNTRFFGLIDGVSQIQKNYAILITSFIENSQLKTLDVSYEEQYLSIILGDMPKSKILQFQQKYSVPKKNCYCILFKSSKNDADEVKNFLNDYVLNDDNVVKIDGESCALIRFCDALTDGAYDSPIEYAEYTIRSIFEELGIEISAYIGSTVTCFSDVSLSYKQAQETIKMATLFGSTKGVFAYKYYLLLKMAEDMPSNKIQEFLTMLLDSAYDEILKDEEIMSTAEAFLNNDLNVSETARALYLHRNTLIYRIDKIKKLTGMDIRKFNDALVFKIISTLVKLK